MPSSVDRSAENAGRRGLNCARCGTAFECTRDSACWCAAEPYRLRMTDPAKQQDCLCRDCLRKAAAAEGHVASRA